MNILWVSDDPSIIKGVLKVIGVLTLNNKQVEWINHENRIPRLLNYLQSRDDDFVVFSVRAIGNCSNHIKNLQRLMEF
jgi:hypothetical protein